MNQPLATIQRLLAATNAHDVDAIVACFADDYVLDSPIHPSRSFRGTEQVRRNWAGFIAGVPDIVTRLVDYAEGSDNTKIWTEWTMIGTRAADGAKHDMRGVFIFTVRDGLIRSGRMFLEPVAE